MPTRMRGLGGGAVVGLGELGGLLVRVLPGIFGDLDEILVELAVGEKAVDEGHGRDVVSNRVLARRTPLVEAGKGPVPEHGLEGVHVGVEVQDLVPGGVDDPEIVEDEGCEGMVLGVKVELEVNADKTLVELSGPILHGVSRHGTGMRGGRECYI